MTATSDLLETASRRFNLGDLSGAEQACVQLLQAEPYHVQALHFFGLLCHQRGRHVEAIAFLRHATRSAPANPDIFSDLGAACAAAGSLVEAIAYYQETLRWKPDHARAHNNLAVALAAQGQFAEAIIHYQQALQANPSCALTHNNLGVALAEQGRLAEAEEHYRQAVQLKPDCASGYSNWAGLLIELGRPEEAIRGCLHALHLDPEHVPAYAHLADLGSQSLYQFTDDQVHRMECLLASDRISAHDASRIHYILAARLDRQGEHDHAFAHYRRANDLQSEVFRQRNLAFDREGHRRLIDNIIATFDRRFFDRVRSFGLPTEVPVFIVGMPRSGTTLVAQILSSHPHIAAAGERRDLADIVTARASYPAWMSGLDQQTVRVLAQDYLNRLSRFGPTAARILDKMPHNFLHLGSIAALFPNARIIHCRRDPMDVCLSCYFQNFSWVNYACSLKDLGFYYRQYERLMHHWREVLPALSYDVQYEDLVHDQERISREMLSYCGMDWSDRCLAFFENGRVVQTASKLQVRQPMYRSSIARWKRYEKRLLPLQQALAGEPPPPATFSTFFAEPTPIGTLDEFFASFDLEGTAP